VIEIDTVLIKVASRCNINCTYCYVYNAGDDGWKEMPNQISPETTLARLLADPHNRGGRLDPKSSLLTRNSIAVSVQTVDIGANDSDRPLHIYRPITATTRTVHVAGYGNAWRIIRIAPGRRLIGLVRRLLREL
jgi:hypothetical protein